MADFRMPDLNKVSLAGRLTRDPELKYIASGTPICKLGLAVSRKYKLKSGETKEDTLFVNVTVWGQSAEFANEYMKKGTPIYVEGRLTSNEWEDKNTGQKRSAVEITADRVQSLAWGDDQGQGGNQGQGSHSSGGGHYNQQQQNAPKPRVIEEPIPEDDIPF